MKLSRTWQRLALASTMISTIALSASVMAQDAVQLTFRQFDPPTEIAGLIAAVDAWNASHPNIQVKLETLGGGDTLAQLPAKCLAWRRPGRSAHGLRLTRDLARSNLLLDSIR